MTLHSHLRIPLLDTEEMPITGYFDRLSVRPGERLQAHVSVADGAAYKARLVRVISGDPNPAGPGMVFEDLSDRFAIEAAGGRQPLAVGSFADVAEGPDLSSCGAVTWTALIWFATPPRHGAVISQGDAAAHVTLAVTPSGLQALLADAGETQVRDLPTAMQAGVWHRVWLSVDAREGQVVLGCQPVGGLVTAQAFDAPGLRTPSDGRLTIAADAVSQAGTCFTGKIEAPAVLDGAYRDAAGLDGATGLIAGWDFSQNIDTQSVAAVGPKGRDGVLRRWPVRGVKGASWTGEEQSWRHAPREYAAIHFHEDDFGSCDWRPSFAFTAPDDLKSGAYALHLTTAAGEDWLPFYVLPPRAGPRQKVCFLAPTYTYQAYGNCYFANRLERTQARGAAWGASAYCAVKYGSYGRSTYNWHADGSGVSLSSRLRPLLTMRPGFIFEEDPRGSGLRHYPADTHLLAWLEDKQIPFDVVTDEDLDDEGAGLIDDYDLVLTGSHPEYHTAGTLDALATFVAKGGNLAYLGGNGFYWRIARQAQHPEMIEVRRAEGGIRTWAAEPGEYYHQLDGRLGGIWRRNGRTPQALVGIGFSAQGPFESTYYRIAPDARSGPGGWILDGVDQDIFGDYGLSGGGAAGFELDRADPALGAPGAVHILASSEDPPKSFGVVHEEMLTESLTMTGESPERLVRADMVYVETPAGGRIFSTGSITFCGSLWNGEGFQGPVSRILENVVRGFLDAGA
ncbi:N,N-dimethylformamidase beta subunit family domain-containing protein [Caulobacter sp. UNC279MFTsu5.1]|uniref:N,N-dimethylformamidase beta subunit family domain-containing protein n=1 Tax=Caulobacter sp. UNC279MFTsu5.1 TaxID=1502775 RepID=UPI00037A89EB|nr:N,N-dimethylformamidase beta subunit family domain-containing protein [Caulobacter sp. UNC279MFTsu5.1]SFI57881.1 N,N-dimethylformamidase [Caulobacter sp. UNC279MFTsu5.1]